MLEEIPDQRAAVVNARGISHNRSVRVFLSSPVPLFGSADPTADPQPQQAQIAAQQLSQRGLEHWRAAQRDIPTTERKHRLQNALASLRRAVSLMPGAAVHRANLGALLQAVGAFEASVAPFTFVAKGNGKRNQQETDS